MPKARPQSIDRLLRAVADRGGGVAAQPKISGSPMGACLFVVLIRECSPIVCPDETALDVPTWLCCTPSWRQGTHLGSSAQHFAGLGCGETEVTMTPSSRRRVVMQLQNVKRSSRAKVKNAGRSKMRTAECLISFFGTVSLNAVSAGSQLERHSASQEQLMT